MQYFLKTQRCKFGSKCKFNHPKDKLIGSVGDIYEKFTKLINFMVNYFLYFYFYFYIFNQQYDALLWFQSDSGNGDVSALPERPSEPPCAVRFSYIYFFGEWYYILP